MHSIAWGHFQNGSAFSIFSLDPRQRFILMARLREASRSCFCSHLHRINALQQRRTLLSPTTMKHHHLINANRGEFASSVPIPLPTSHIHRTRSELQLAQDELLADYQDGRMYERICKSLCSISPVRLSLLCGLTIPLRFCFFSIWYPSALRYDG